MTKTPLLRGFSLFSVILVGFPLSAMAQFADMTAGPLVTSGTTFGVAWGDVDKDGDFDLFMAKGSGPSELLRNDGPDVFSPIAGCNLGDGGDMSTTIVDYDNDGDLDIYVTNANWASRMLRNDNGTFVSASAGDCTGNVGYAQSAAWADYDRDGDLDLFVTHYEEPNKLYRNDGNGILHDVTPASLAANPQRSAGAAWGDFDNDGDPDLYVGGHTQGHLFRNDAGTFVDVTALSLGALGKAGVNGVAWGDCDSDGDLDLYLARDLNSSRLIRNDCTPGVVNFIDYYNVVVRDPGAGEGVTWIDYDADGDLDIFLAKAGADNASGAPNALFRNNGWGDSYTDVSAGPVLQVANSRGVACGDYDGNGTPDLYVANWGSSNQMLSTTGSGSHWTEVRLVGTHSNTYGIGARVRVVAGAKKQIREISGGSGIYSQDAPVALFGVYLQTVVDSIQVYWPSGIVTDTVNVPINHIITMRETPQQQTGIGDNLPVAARLLTASPNPFRAGTTIAYELKNASPVRLLVVDAEGRLTRVLEASQLKEPGTYSQHWDGRDAAGGPVAAGVYYYSLTTNGFRKSYPVVLVR
jgi:ASPIC/UnbV protein/VCBS repeat protein/flagellar hook capping protein FlgD